MLLNIWEWGKERDGKGLTIGVDEIIFLALFPGRLNTISHISKGQQNRKLSLGKYTLVIISFSLTLLFLPAKKVFLLPPAFQTALEFRGLREMLKSDEKS